MFVRKRHLLHHLQNGDHSSKDKKDEWVTLWYTEIVTDKTGKTDSLAMVNDIKVSKGKIVELNESVRHFPTKKL